jgi:nucleotide-binding universal stress UspA family protein
MAGKICVPLDGTKYAEQVVPLVAEIAAKSNMSVALVSVIDPDELDVILTAGEGVPRSSDYATRGRQGMNVAQERGSSATGAMWNPAVGSPQNLSPDEAKALDQANTQARSYLFSIERWLADRGVEASSSLGFGDAEEGIVDEAARTGSTMIAMTGRSKSFWERGALGSTADHVVNAAPMPVLVFKPMDGLAEAVSVVPKTVVVALDGSKQAEQGLKPAADLARAVGAQMALVQVVKGNSEAKRGEAEQYLASVASRAGVQATTRVRSGSADEQIILCADEFDSPLIALTEHGAKSFGKWFRGSTTDKVVRNSGYPVLVSPVVDD